MRKHEWKTPLEAVTHTAPSLSHLKLYGCRAYAHKHGLPKKAKLDQRAHVGHLVGYDSTNIFRIWIPSKRKIICTRNVVFDEGKRYDPTEPDLPQLVTEPIIETTFHIPQHFGQTTASMEIDDEDVSITDLDASENVILPTTEATNLKASKTPTSDAANAALPTDINTPTPEPPGGPSESSPVGPSESLSKPLHLRQRAKRLSRIFQLILTNQTSYLSG